MIQETYTLIATRVPPGDRWLLSDDSKRVVHPSLTDALEAYYQKTQQPCDFKLAPLKGELYVINAEEVAPPPPKKFNLYGDY